MTSIFQAIGDFLYSVVNLLINFMSGIAQLLVILPQSVTMVLNSVASMPSMLTAFAVGLVTVSVVYLIIAR